MEIRGFYYNEMMEARKTKLEDSLNSHIAEMKSLERKIRHPQVPPGKKAKCLYRLKVIKEKVLPEINKKLAEIDFII